MKTKSTIKSGLLVLLFIVNTAQYAHALLATIPPGASISLKIPAADTVSLIPRITKIQRDAITFPNHGLLIYQTDKVNGFYCYNEVISAWKPVCKDFSIASKAKKTLEHISHSKDINSCNNATVLNKKPAVAIGDYHAGGVVFYIAPIPTDLDGDGRLDTGLVCAINDQTKASNGAYLNTNAKGFAIGSGNENTKAIIDVQTTQTSHASALARAYRGGGYTDWFLPAKAELHEMYQNRALINTTASKHGGSNFTNGFYWSSTEHNCLCAWFQNFLSGNQNKLFKHDKNYLRAVRAF